ncbi:MAG: substrate-binding domain-containing protein [Chloroflexi bacterium]|nr:substrate-binding domain-containing protein [Chloroflexota bacterium]
MWRLLALALALALAASALWPAAACAEQPPLILGTTIDLQRTGLLDVLAPAFERQTSRSVTVVAVSAPHALVLGIRGELDVLLVDAGDDEPGFMGAGHGVERRLVMHGDEVLVGPRNDPAGLRQTSSPADALRRIAQTGAAWISRADNSALYQIEKQLWRDAGIDPLGQPWYQPYGQGMTATLAAATERQAYTLADRPTFLERQSQLDLAIQVEKAPDLLRLYHVIVANPARGPWIDEAGARAFMTYVLGPEAQELIRGYGTDRFGQPIFTPDAGRVETDVRPARRTGG